MRGMGILNVIALAVLAALVLLLFAKPAQAFDLAPLMVIAVLVANLPFRGHQEA